MVKLISLFSGAFFLVPMERRIIFLRNRNREGFMYQLDQKTLVSAIQLLELMWQCRDTIPIDRDIEHAETLLKLKQAFIDGEEQDERIEAINRG